MLDEKSKLIPFLTFAGQAEDAMNHYQKVFTQSERVSLTRNDEKLTSETLGQVPGKVLNGQLKIKDQLISQFCGQHRGSLQFL